MPGIFAIGTVPVRPGPAFAFQNIGEPPKLPGAQGTGAAVIRGTRGVLNTIVEVESMDQLDIVFGTGGTTDLVREMFRGGIDLVKTVRVGDTSAQAVYAVQDTTAGAAVHVGDIQALQPGSDGNAISVTIRDNLSNTLIRDLLVYYGTQLVQTINFTKYANAGDDESANLRDAINNGGSDWIHYNYLAIGNGHLAAVANTTAMLAGGTDPGTITTSMYTAALGALELDHEWEMIAVDVEDSTMQATVQSWVDRLNNEGSWVMGILGQPTSVPLTTRLANAKAMNDIAVGLVINGFTGADGAVREGYKAAARTVGMMASENLEEALTYSVVQNAVGIYGSLANADVINSLNAGAIVFTKNLLGEMVVEQGLTTFSAPTQVLDAGWKKLHRTRIRFAMIRQIQMAWLQLTGHVENDIAGRGIVRGSAQGIINDFINRGLIAPGGAVTEDSTQPGPDVYQVVIRVDDNDVIEHFLAKLQFRWQATA
jgi:Phage tail sheath protein subtilisin-like domain